MGQSDTSIMEGRFSLMGSRREHDLILLNSAIKYWQYGTSYKARTIFLDDIVGVQCMKGSTTADNRAYLTLYVYAKGKTLTGKVDSVRTRRVFVFGLATSHVFTDNLQVANLWRQAIRGLMRPSASLRHFSGVWLVVINPSGGQGKAVKIFQERVGPILSEADIPFEVVISEKLGHITEVARNMDLNKFTAIVVVSGDGLIHEVINGLMTRPDWYRAIQTPLGLIPAGSGNALAASIHEACGETFKQDFVKHAALLLTKSIPTRLDLIYLDTIAGEKFAFLSVGWGIMADIDIESEKFRALGETRFTVGALQRVIDLRVYSGTLSYLPATEISSCETSPAPPDIATAAGDFLPRPSTDLLSPLSEPVPSSWTVIQGDFISVYMVSISRLGISSVGVPWAKLDDGLVYLFWMRGGAPKSAVVSFLLNLSSGEHLKSSHMEVAAVRAFRFEPAGKDGIMTVDGERVPYGAIQGQVLPSVGRVLTRQPNLLIK